MGDLVPERCLPVELAGGAGPRRVERDHAAETRAQRADHPWQAERTHREVIVARKHLNQNGSSRSEFITRREIVQCLLGQRQHIVLHDRRFVPVQSDDKVSHLKRLEFLQRIEQIEQVVGHDVIRVFSERPLERFTRGRLVTGAQQMQSQFRIAPGIVRVDLQSASNQYDCLREPVIASGQIPGHPVDITVGRVDRQHSCDLGVKVVETVLDVGHRGDQGSRLQATRVDRECARDGHGCGVVVPVVEVALSKKQMGLKIVRRNLERRCGQLARCRRIRVSQRAGEAQVSRSPLVIQLEDILK